MPPSGPDDQSLLHRLNALKPTTVTLDRPANVASLLPAPAEQPASREDALAARLRVLRNQPTNSTNREQPNSRNGGGQPPDIPGGHNAGTTAPPHPSLGGRSPKGKEFGQAFLVPPVVPDQAVQGRGPYCLPDSDAGDEEGLEAILGSLGDEDFDLPTDEHLEPAPEFADLLEPLQKGPPISTSGEGNTPSEDDNSDGEQMTYAVETILSRIEDEIKSLPQPPSASVKNGQGALEQRESCEGENASGADSGPLAGDRGEFPLLTLPAVPSQLVDPVPVTKQDEDFERDVSARLASLRGLGSVDALGLPSAPTFRPRDRPTSTPSGSLLRSSKYTDADQTTWCVVCLEDATIRCTGCDNDVYCARCWREMHVGPSAGYDERGHKWVRLDRHGHP